MEGISAPGLMDWGSTIHPARLPRVFGSVPAAIVSRLPRCVRSGPTLLPAGVPWIEYQNLVRVTDCVVEPSAADLELS